MKHILLNLKSFFNQEKIIFFLILLCVISSSFVINFAYGLYYNFDTQKAETNDKLKDVFFTDLKYDEEGRPIAWKYNEGLTKNDLQRYIKALSEKTINSIEAIYVDSFITELADEQYPTGDRVIFHFTYHNGKYGINEEVRDIAMAENKGEFKPEGRYFTDEEMNNGSLVAVVNPYSIAEYKNILVDDDTIRLFGKDFKIIGKTDIKISDLYIPFTSLPDEQNIVIFEVLFKRNITRSIYTEMKQKADEIIPERLYFPELEGIDRDDMAIYNNMIAISLCISVLSTVNFAMLYHFLIEKRQKQLAIMRMCGCKKVRAVFTYLGECILITLPAYGAGILINKLLIHSLPSGMLEFMEDAYSPKVYGTLFGVYIAAFAVILLFMITKSVNKTIAEEWKG